MRFCQWIFIFLIFSPPLYAEKSSNVPYKDAGLWTSIAMENRIIKNVDGEIVLGVRLHENITCLNSVFATGGLTYRFTRNFRIGTTYRYFITNDENPDIRQRFTIDVSHRIKMNVIRFNYRLRWEQEFENINTSENGYIPEKNIRNKLLISYNKFNAIKPFISGELFYQISNVQPVNNFNKQRTSLGIEWELKNRDVVSVAYMQDRDFNVVNPELSHIIILTYTFSKIPVFFNGE